ncbi:NUDIX hydrolase [Rhodococcus sp. BP-252]|uniref:NUDIX hydrolase n=1 Tax=unclassified Rhodococcus (in: high G+C Gram-positive bacteria) TaxID=192944 RepID=UPI001C9AEABF|nr:MULTISPECIES: NUDIX hydrolase [unclassified Rhodococcus (in: high G+C Gram-positive bacteria)]MBY6413898.1 NUDIX hydrolase [Rhodococcus sp. BP-320]MBY6418652.1 NUDIX hydrolase [Rhodococcus sp. BP-321]MBY6422947.1 NUDIX hydrolase [Rhodococcus sp. BP-324]MBY6428704.1 NUDIX hydrolase [Rhodococcus sp. BP-323]MBY6433773.1 NUDIX hydrolase [Rhodococcus sp. BP-322]
MPSSERETRTIDNIAVDRSALIKDIAREVAAIVPADNVERTHRDQVLRWLAETQDVFRRVANPVAPVRHLVSYFMVFDVTAGLVLLGEHIKAGLWLPPGGHVEPGEHPVDTVVRECREELGIDATFLPAAGRKPVFVTITDTVGSANVHNDVSLWYCLSVSRDTPMTIDPGEYTTVRWWSQDEITAAEPAKFDPHMIRMLRKLNKDGLLEHSF